MSARILIVDDNPLNLKLLAAKLAHDYYIVSTAEDGLEALKKAESEKPDIILLDVMMPKLDGFETCKRLKANPATTHIPIVMITALTDVTDRVKGLEAGADDFLTKPINDLALMARVRSLLRLKMIMDEWRLRDVTSSKFLTQAPDEDPNPVTAAGGHILLLEDVQPEQLLIREMLAKLSATVTLANSITEATTLAQTGDFDAVFVSLNLSHEDALLLCPRLRTNTRTRQLPIVLLGQEGEMDRVAKGLDLGANDYILRPLDGNELLARARTQLKHKRHYDRLLKNYEYNLALALVDPLTGAFNRRYLDAHLPRMMARSTSHLKPLSALMIDIDYFKKINDTYGHAAGDIVLKEVVNRITNGLRPSDLVSRLGGEEFAIIMPETSLASAQAIGERLLKRLAATPVAITKDKSISMTVSIGCACLRENDDNAVETLLRRADLALYQAKENGRNRVVAEKVGPASDA